MNPSALIYRSARALQVHTSYQALTIITRRYSLKSLTNSHFSTAQSTADNSPTTFSPTAKSHSRANNSSNSHINQSAPANIKRYNPVPNNTRRSPSSSVDISSIIAIDANQPSDPSSLFPWARNSMQ
jgi:hypothetical protein